MIQVTDIYIYPVKSLKGIPLKEAETGLRGFKYDREWMITDSDYQFLTQREIEAMATITVSIAKDFLLLESSKGNELKINLNVLKGKSQFRCQFGTIFVMHLTKERLLHIG